MNTDYGYIDPRSYWKEMGLDQDKILHRETPVPETAQPSRYAPAAAAGAPFNGQGCRPAKYMTEADVRRIVREELAKQAFYGPPVVGYGGLW